MAKKIDEKLEEEVVLPQEELPVLPATLPPVTASVALPQGEALPAQKPKPKKLDETVPGGRYIVDVTPLNPNGRVVDANGQAIKE